MGKVLLASDSRQTCRRIDRDLLSVSVGTEKQEIEPRLANPALCRDGVPERPVLTKFEQIRTELAALYRTWHEEQARLGEASQHHI